MKKDGHIHTPYCPHGTLDPFHAYIEKAIHDGFNEISFTEHAPLPENFLDPTPDQDSGMNRNRLEHYLTDIAELKKQYKSDIVISTGLEVDYISGFERETTLFLNTYGKFLDDSILSVHFLPFQNEYICIDYSKSTYLDFVQQVGSANAVYKLYYKTLLDSITSNLGEYKPNRIGHITLVHKFQHALLEKVEDHDEVISILLEMKRQKLELDVNSAGLSKAHCLESYPPPPYIKLAKDFEIPLVFGSDAHQSKDLHQHYDKLKTFF